MWVAEYLSAAAVSREGLVGWEGLDSVIGGSRRGRDGGRSRGSGGRGREGRARHSGGRGPASGGGRFDHDSSQFERHGGPGRCAVIKWQQVANAQACLMQRMPALLHLLCSKDAQSLDT